MRIYAHTIIFIYSSSLFQLKLMLRHKHIECECEKQFHFIALFHETNKD